MTTLAEVSDPHAITELAVKFPVELVDPYDTLETVPEGRYVHFPVTVLLAQEFAMLSVMVVPFGATLGPNE
jgi:hypothetical protein